MDATSPEMINFVVVPVETIVICGYIVDELILAICEDPSNEESKLEDFQALSRSANTIVQNVKIWPLIAKESSTAYDVFRTLHEVASYWLERSPIFKKHLSVLREYLELLPGFSASGLETSIYGTIKDREMILLEQQREISWYKNQCQHSDVVRAKDLKRNQSQYHQFLTRLMWMRDDPLSRMFQSYFKGEYQDHPKDSDCEELSYQLESFSVAALTERADNDTAESNAIKLPTLKYIAIIETDNDNKAIFDLEYPEVNQDKHKVLVIAKDMCTEMVSKGYESKVKLQDIMEMAVKMAKK
ncbi:uncharacterized protein J4E92_009232 [Alternaria infectoria]|uniref:uncharacterized protein n=1 Tax=Alternaria infectoria TaxID=45303 RepID=UPI00221F46C0|nr:uncharacterized protein J4E92_009232 [Alternaria infectoria]KAI4916315.1 hypothetical protein J4E92_009232 [Alternaria infectoria]